MIDLSEALELVVVLLLCAGFALAVDYLHAIWLYMRSKDK